MDLLERFQHYITEHALFSKTDHLLLAVSGGVDSVVLSELLARCGFTFTIAHCNFHLRGEESDRDEAFVKTLADKHGREFRVKQFDTEKYAEEKKISIQVAARELRYQWFHELLGSIPSAASAKWIVTAHHLDDNIETVLMNFFKGTGLPGMRGMLPKSGKIVRPLLFAKKGELLEFAKQNGLAWVEDSSNALDKYARNFLRHQLIPLIEKIYPSAIDNLQNNIERFREMEKMYDAAIDSQLKKIVERKGAELHIPVLKLKKTASPKTIIYELISPFGFSAVRVDEVMQLMDADTGKYLLSESHRILKNRNWLIISPLQVEMQEHVLIDSQQRHLYFQGGNLELRLKPATEVELDVGNTVALIDAGKIAYPLILRRWKQGDYFYPLGMQKKKKLARFFIDQKLSLAQKEKAWVIEMDKKIIWVVGMRIDDRFKVSSTTKHVLQIKFSHRDEM